MTCSLYATCGKLPARLVKNLTFKIFTALREILFTRAPLHLVGEAPARLSTTHQRFGGAPRAVPIACETRVEVLRCCATLLLRSLLA